MFKSCVYRWLNYLPALVMILFLSSCFNSRKAQTELEYLQGKRDTVPNLTVNFKEATIQKRDLLSIFVYSDNPQLSAIFNQQQGAVSPSSSGTEALGISGAGATSAPNGYLVDQQGNIYIQSVGSIHAEGLTRSELSKIVSQKLSAFLRNPYAEVRFVNPRFTVIGEVNKPGTFPIPNEKVTLLEMLGMVGDLTVYGRRDNILVIRENNGKREFGEVDLHKADVVQSPYYFLQQNDVVIVRANKKKPTGNEQATLRNLSIVTGIASLISIAAVIINIFR